MQKTIKLNDVIEISIKTNNSEGTALTQLESRKENESGIFVVDYRVDPGDATQVTLPEVEIKVEFPLVGVARLMAPHDFDACSRFGMWYSTDWTTNASGYEPFALFVAADGKCKYLVGLASLEHY